MNTARVRALIAITVVGVFMFITAFMAIFPLVSPTNVQLTEYADFFVKTASVYTGIIGVIIGGSSTLRVGKGVVRVEPSRQPVDESATDSPSS